MAPPTVTAAPCDQWPPSATSGSLGSLGSLGSSSDTGSLARAIGSSAGPATPWKTGESGYIPRLSGRTQVVELVTGRTSPNDTVGRFGISGTDLGIPWDNGDGQVLIAFGDTMGDCVGDAQWRSNVLLRSSDRTLADGMRIDDAPMEAPGLAKSILPRSGLPGERTVIPTAGIAVNGIQYLRYMSVVDWGAPGEWKTNYSALASSADNGETWTRVPGSERVGDWAIAGATAPEGAPALPSLQMSSFLADGEFVYEYATPAGRHGRAHLARVPRDRIEEADAYRYWDGEDWVTEADRAVPVMDGTVSELSTMWNPYLGKFLAMYTDSDNNVVMRQADRPEGPWSGTQTIVSRRLIPTMYGAFMHPWSDGSDLYYLTSTWDAYNVFLMKTDLTGMRKSSFDRVNEPDPATTGEAAVVGVQEIPVS